MERGVMERLFRNPKMIRDPNRPAGGFFISIIYCRFSLRTSSVREQPIHESLAVPIDGPFTALLKKCGMKRLKELEHFHRWMWKMGRNTRVVRFHKHQERGTNLIACEWIFSSFSHDCIISNYQLKSKSSVRE